MTDSILGHIEHHTIQTAKESLDIYRLGTFGGATVELVELNQGQVYPPHVHDKSEAVLEVIAGTGTIILDGAPLSYRQGDRYRVPPGMSHGFRVSDQTVLLSFQEPPIFNSVSGEIDVRYIDDDPPPAGLSASA